MQLLWILLFGASLGILIGIAGIIPRRSVLSLFELRRREKEGSLSAVDELRRELLIDDVLSLRKIAESLLLILVVAFGLLAFGPAASIMIAIIVAVVYPRVAASSFVATWAARMYERQESAVLSLIEGHPKLFASVRSVSRHTDDTPLSSRAELEHIVDTAEGLLTSNEKKLIRASLNFKEKTVSEIMTPRSVVATIAKDELVGPLTLDELHKTGYSRFPVIDEDIDHVVGILHIKELLTVGQKDSETAAEAMQKKVYYINQNQSLEHALAAFIKTRHHLFIVINGYRETVGIVTLEDVMESLLGREIVDEFDLHEDLRVVAERSAAANNNTPDAINV